MEAYVELDEKIFEAYCEQKTEPLVGALEPGMYMGYFEWHNCPIPTGESDKGIQLCKNKTKKTPSKKELNIFVSALKMLEYDVMVTLGQVSVSKTVGLLILIDSSMNLSY